MNNTTLHNLFERLRVELRITKPKTLRKKIQREASKLGLTTDEALFILAKENGIGYQREFRKLKPESRQSITDAIREYSSNSSNITNTAKAKAPSFRGKNRTTTIKTKFGSITEPYLPHTINQEAVDMAEQAYLSLYILENSVRSFVLTVMKKNYGEDWWKHKMGTKKLKDIAAKVTDRQKTEEKNRWHGKRGAHPIYYSDFGDLSVIIETYCSNFRPYFSNLKYKESSLLLKLAEIEPSRNVTAHHNPLKNNDLNRVHGYLIDWVSQLEYIKDNYIL